MIIPKIKTPMKNGQIVDKRKTYKSMGIHIMSEGTISFNVILPYIVLNQGDKIIFRFKNYHCLGEVRKINKLHIYTFDVVEQLKIMGEK